VIADYLAQRVLEPTQLPVGALTILIGGPYFLLLLLRASRAGLAA
jgi:iron complex transport system permease protein